MSETEFVLPGHSVKQVKSLRGVTILGPGLRQNEEKPNTLRVTQPGILCFKEPNVYWIEGNRTRYIPKKGDLVVGVILKKSGDTLKIDIGSAEHGALSMLAFEGATKKQKPDVQVGDVVYTRLLNAHREMEPELVCIDSYYKAGPLGVLSNDGFLMNVSIVLAHKLLDIQNPMLRSLGKRFAYEIVVGVNGKIWINAKKTKDILNLMKIFEIADQHPLKDLNEINRLINY